MMGAPTPGPWTTDLTAEHLLVYGPDGALVADCMICAERPLDACLANARFIAQSPRTFEALVDALGAMTAAAETGRTEHLLGAMTAARAAINAAVAQ